MKNRLCKSVPKKFVSVTENVDAADVVQNGVDCIWNIPKNGKIHFTYSYCLV